LAILPTAKRQSIAHQVHDAGLHLALRIRRPDLYSWIGGFFGDCKVIEPVELKEKMRGLHLEAGKDGSV
jgi:hypothetical protein